MRLGYYKLNREKIKSNDWVWVIDHSIQIGKEKCLVILGIRLEDLPTDRSLNYEDVEPIELIPVTKSNGDIVYEQLNIAMEKTGVPREIIGDKCSDIKSGIERFCSENTGTCYIHDVKHGLALILQKILDQDQEWQSFTKLCTDLKNQVQQTELAALTPPNQRSKSRYMNIDTLINWAGKMIKFLNQEKAIISTQFNFDKLSEKFSWIRGYEMKINEWCKIAGIVSHAENFVRVKGIYSDMHMLLNKELAEFAPHGRAKQIKDSIIDFIKKESASAKPGERLLGSSEIIESIFGKQKTIEKQQSKSGFTSLLLTIPALLSTTTKDIIQKAFETTKIKTITQWGKKNIGQSLQAKRLAALGVLKKSEQKQSQETLAAYG